MPHPLVLRSDLIVGAVGAWTSFHDMKVVQFARIREACEMTLHVWRPTSEVDAKGYYVNVSHHLARFRMEGVVDCTLPAGYEHDTLLELTFSAASGLVKATFQSVTDQNGFVLCTEVAVVDVKPCGSDGRSR